MLGGTAQPDHCLGRWLAAEKVDEGDGLSSPPCEGWQVGEVVRHPDDELSKAGMSKSSRISRVVTYSLLVFKSSCSTLYRLSAIAMSNRS